NYAWTAYGKTGGIPGLKRNGILRWHDRLQPEDKISKRLYEGRIGSWARTAAGDVKLVVRFFKDVPLDQAEELLKNYQGITVTGKSAIQNSLIVESPEDIIGLLAGEDIVQWIEESPPPRIRVNDGVQINIGADVIQSVPYNLSGTDTTVGIWDGGHADKNHDDFGERVTYGDLAGVDEHATHVGGTVGGSGILSKSRGGTEEQWKGVAPETQIISYEWTDSVIEHDKAINTYDIDISQNSWGYAIGWDPGSGIDYENRDLFGDYLTESAEYDAVVSGYYGKKISVVFAAANDRSDVSPEGVPDPLHPDGYECMSPFASAKNVIAVGAVRSNDDGMTGFSNWGPTNDGRIKPDVVAPGAQWDGDRGVTSTIPLDRYGVMQGTSMAAPVVSGSLAALIEQYKNTYNGFQPLPSTLKGLLIHSATDLGNTGPDYQNGYGRISLDSAVELIRFGGILEASIEETGEVDVYYLNIEEGQSEIKVSLVWDDEPGEPISSIVLVNDLDLVLEDPEGGIFHPWILDPEDPGSPAATGEDHLNNIEQIVVSDPIQGRWTLKVAGYAVPSSV
ncbi:MAG: S8 family serine peptidase, partial [Desulfobulbaceae bacterium]|nr:S8 family serine peptidase [Desulfobulbaceae bacterium]